MKIFIIRHEWYSFSMFGPGGGSEQIGTYSSLSLAKNKLKEIKDSILAKPGMVVEEFSNQYGCLFGVSYGHKMGSMSFIPGCYKITETEVIDS